MCLKRSLYSMCRRFAIALSLYAAMYVPAHADAASSVVERDGKFYLYHNGKPLTAAYDSLSIDKNEGYPDLVIARQGKVYGLIDAQTGKIVLPVEYGYVDTDTLTRFGLITIWKDGKPHFITYDGRASNVPEYDVLGKFEFANDHTWQALAERDGKLLIVILNEGRFVNEAPAPKYRPIVILPPGLREPPTKQEGPLNGVYVPAAYPDLQTAWTAWRRGELREPGQPAIVVKGDIAYVSFGEFVAASMRALPNTLRACQSDSGLDLRGMGQGDDCALKVPPLFRFQRESDNSLRCIECSEPLPKVWIPLPPVERSIVGIGAGLSKQPGETSARIVSVVPGGPAAQAKLQAGDLVANVDGDSIASLSTAQIVDRIRGKAGTSIKLDVVRGSRQFTVDIERREIKLSTNPAELW